MLNISVNMIQLQVGSRFEKPLGKAALSLSCLPQVSLSLPLSLLLRGAVTDGYSVNTVQHPG